MSLPPPNPSAYGLYLTNEEWLSLQHLIEADGALLRVRVYGSRQSGVRRAKDPPQPIDIDLAIEVKASDPDEGFTEFFDAARRLEERGGKLLIQVEDLTDSTSEWFVDRQAGVLILDRTK